MAEPTIAERATAAGFGLGWRAGWAFDSRPARATFDLAADIGWRRAGAGPGRLRENLRRVLGAGTSESEVEAVTRYALRSYARYFREVFWLPRAEPGEVAGRTRYQGADQIADVLNAGRGVLCALPHTANWDAAAVAYLARFGGPLTVVAERLRPESLYQRFRSYRQGLGMRVVPLTGGDQRAASLLAATLREGGTVCLLCERDLSSSGVPVEFFGETITVPPGPALLAAQTGAALVPTVPGFVGDNWDLRFFPEVRLDGPQAPARLRDRVTAAMQSVVDRFEIEIARAPQDWHMVQRLWQEDLAPSQTGRTSS